MQVSLTTKIFLAFAFLLSTFAALAFFSVREFHEIGQELRSINEGHLALARLAGQLETIQQNRFRDLRRAQAEPDPRNREVVLRIAAAYFPDVVRARTEEFHALSNRELARLPPGRDAESSSKRQFYRSLLARVERLAEEHEMLDELGDQLLARARAGLESDDLDPEIGRLESVLRGELYQLNRTIDEETDRAVTRAEIEERNAIWRVIAMTTAAILVGVLITFLSARTLAPIRELVAFARAISRGDYERPLDLAGEDEMSQLAEELRQMARSRKEREAELDRQQAELETAYHWVADLKRYHESVVQSLKTAVIVTDRELTVTSANRAAENRLGIAPGEVKGRPLDSLPIGIELVARLGPLGSLLESRAPARLTGVPLGELRVDAAITPLENEHGALLGLVLAVEDVTEAVRTKEALIRSERLAAIGRMSAHVTHEVRNPLSSIGLNAELLEALVAESGMTGAKLEESQSLSRAIGREVDRLTAITEEYLRFARLPRPELTPVDLRLLLSGLATFVRRDCEAAGIELVLGLPTDAPLVEVDPDQIRQAVLNLVRNGKESMPSGGRLELALEVASDEVAIAIRDTGVGIDPANLDRIFDPFFSTKLTGTGLGLALCHQIVAEHGGYIQVRSTPGSGSEFRIVLSRRQRPETTQVHDASPSPRAGAVG